MFAMLGVLVPISVLIWHRGPALVEEWLPVRKGCRAMRQQKVRPIRNTVNLADTKQVRAIRRRFGVSEEELARIVSKIGNSIAAIGKEVALQRAAELAQPSNEQKAPAALIAANSRRSTQKQKPAGPVGARGAEKLAAQKVI